MCACIFFLKEAVKKYLTKKVFPSLYLMPYTVCLYGHWLFNGSSPGYGISLVAKTTSGCCISADTVVSYAQQEEIDELEDLEKKELVPPEDVGEQIASVLLGEIEQGGVVDSTHQVCVLFFCALVLTQSFNFPLNRSDLKPSLFITFLIWYLLVNPFQW